jgi:hypothetical protein
VAVGFVVEAIMTDSERKTDSERRSERKTDSDSKIELMDDELNAVSGGIVDGTDKEPLKSKVGRA